MLQRLGQKDAAWCSLRSALSDRSCELQLSPFGTTYVAVRKPIVPGAPNQPERAKGGQASRMRCTSTDNSTLDELQAAACMWLHVPWRPLRCPEMLLLGCRSATSQTPVWSGVCSLLDRKPPSFSPALPAPLPPHARTHARA